MSKKLPSHVLRYMVLKSFREGPSYGYEIVSRIEQATDGYWSPSYGTIYPLIQRLEEEDLLESVDREEAEELNLDDSDRNYFKLTEEGREEIEPNGDEEEHREKFNDLIIGYMKIYRNKYGEEALKQLIRDAK